jgi:hypothetical protein
VEGVLTFAVHHVDCIDCTQLKRGFRRPFAHVFEDIRRAKWSKLRNSAGRTWNSTIPSSRPSVRSAEEEPELLDFGTGWGDKHCGAFAWYERLICKNLVKILHLAFPGTPARARHEFLFIYFQDGETYKVERIAKASLIPNDNPEVIDVITRVAPHFCDFKAERIEAISLIRFSTPFDAMRFLAACYSLRETHLRTGRDVDYTDESQFFCWTTVTIMARATVIWHNALAVNRWAPVLNKALATSFWADSIGSSIYDNGGAPAGRLDAILVEKCSGTMIVVRCSRNFMSPLLISVPLCIATKAQRGNWEFIDTRRNGSSRIHTQRRSSRSFCSDNSEHNQTVSNAYPRPH